MKKYEKSLLVVANAIEKNEPLMIAKIRDNNEIVPIKWITPRSVSAFEGGWGDDQVVIQVFADGEGNSYYDTRSYELYNLVDGLRIWNDNSED